MKKLATEEWTSLAHHLMECGCPVQLEAGYKVAPVGLAIIQIPSLGVNSVFDLETGGAGYMMDAHIGNELDRPIWIHGFQIKTPWGGAGFSLLSDPTQSVPKQEIYSFPNSTLGFERSVVLNSFLSGNGRLNPGDEIEGLLLGVDEDPLPDEYPDNGRIVVKLSIFDERGNRFSSGFRLCVERSAIYDRKRMKEIPASERVERARERLIVAA